MRLLNIFNNFYVRAILTDLDVLPGFINGGHDLNNKRCEDDTVLMTESNVA